jgi:hypothetical protein
MTNGEGMTLNGEETPEPSSFKHSDLIRHSCFLIISLLIRHFFQPRPFHANFSHKICCDLPEARLVASKFFKIVLGGTAALHAYRVWGAVIF